MVIPFSATLKSYTALLKQVILDDTAFDHPLTVEAHLHKLAKPGAVVVPYCLCVSCIIFFENENNYILVKKDYNI